MDIRDQNGTSIDIAHVEKTEQELAKQCIEENMYIRRVHKYNRTIL